MNNYFSIEEFTQEEMIPPKIAQKILTYHITPMNSIREEFGEPIYISERSGYRSLDCELKNGRSGDSEHVFRGRGAADYTANDIYGLGKLLESSLYASICYYPYRKFYHCDYKVRAGKLFTCEGDGKWHPVQVR